MSEKVDVGLLSQVSHLSTSVQAHYKFIKQKRQEAAFAYDGSMNSSTPPTNLTAAVVHTRNMVGRKS
jgi:hypothetical protein